MAQKKTTKKATAKRTTTKRSTTKQSSTIKGSTNLKTKPKWMNWKVILPLIVIVAAVGGYFYVRQSSASSYTFIRRANQMSYDRSKGRVAATDQKIDGVTYKIKTSQTRPYTFVSADEMRRSSRICAHFRVLERGSTNKSMHIGIQYHIGTSQVEAAVHNVTSGQRTGNVCLNSSRQSRDGTIQIDLDAVSQARVGIDTIYGKP